jgi:hypothetical protein
VLLPSGNDVGLVGRGNSGGPSLTRDVGRERHLRHDTRATAHIELENSGKHDDGLWPMSIFEEGEAERFRAVDEEAATAVLLILNNPIAVAVLANEEEGRSRRRRLVHDTLPFSMAHRSLLTTNAPICSRPAATSLGDCAAGTPVSRPAPRMCSRPHMNARQNDAASHKGAI